MSETVDTMTVVQARQRLQNTRGLSSEQIDEAEKVIDAFRAQRPVNRQCPACHSMLWSEHETASGGASWACSGCHRGADLTQEQWRAAEADRQQAAEARLRTADAAAVPPRTILRERLTALAEARAELSKVEAALPAARAAVTEAESRKLAAEAAAETSSVDAAEGLATSFFEGKKPNDPARAAATARAELAAATDALVIARNAMVIINGKIEDARNAVGYATDKARKAARSVIVTEQLEDLIDDAAEARANYLESVGRLGWLLRNHAIPNDDARPRQILGDANTPPSAWREATTAGDQAMEAAHAALMADSEAAI